MYITENLKSYLVKSEHFTPTETFSGIRAKDFACSQLVGDCDDDDTSLLHYVALGDCGMESPSLY